jgi:membrane carboxypeptidase/penicillin-binding protein
MSRIKSVDQVAFYQLKTMMQGVLARGTARAIADFSPSVAGKTGTSDDENDAWFVGFSNEVTVAVWIGYDNAGSKRRTLGGGATGGGVAVPIFEPVMRAVWNDVTPRTALAPPSPEAKRHLSCSSTESKSIPECLRTDNKGKVIDTTAALETGGSDGRGRYAKRGDERGRREEDTGKHKVAHEHSHRERATSVARQTTPQGWGGGGWFGAATQPTTTGWNYRW